MRISFLCQSYPPMVSGAAITVKNLAEGLSKKGHEVLVLCASNKSYGYNQEENGVTVIRLRSHRNPFRANHRIVLFPKKEIHKLLLNFQPDIIHIEDPSAMSIIALLLKPQLPKSKLVLTVHQLPWFISREFPNYLRNGIEALLWKYGKWVYKHIDAVITPSNTIAKIILLTTGCECKVITNGIDTELFSQNAKSAFEKKHLLEKYNLHPKIPIILFSGRIDPDKRVELVVQAFAKVRQKTNAQLIIVGDGIKYSEVVSLSKSLGVFTYCRFPGFVDQTGDLPGLYRLASVFVIASLVEIQSSVILEAASSGLPSVVFNHGSMPEFVKQEKTGYLVDPDNISEFANKITCIIKDKKLSTFMKYEARQFAMQHMRKKSINQHIELYKKILHTVA